MDGRRNFLKKALVSGATLSLTGGTALADDEIKTSGKAKGEQYKNTYVKNAMVSENGFRQAIPNSLKIPQFEDVKSLLPQPYWQGKSSLEACYWKTWQLAFKNLKNPAEGSGFVSPFLDTAYNGNIFMWDSAFICMFAKYGSRVFPFQKTLDNFYAKQHPDGFICREISAETGQDLFHRYDPVSTGPNLLPWSEWEYFKQFGDMERLHKIFPVLVSYYQWLKTNRTWKDGSYWTSGWGSGMDNQPRLKRGYNPNFSHGHMSWIDANLQQLFTAQLLLKIGFMLERWQEIENIEDEIYTLREFIKQKMWDKTDSFFYDLQADGSRKPVKGIGSYWALFTELLSPEELSKFIAHLEDEKIFKRPFSIPSLSASDPKYRPNGRYWQGGIWAPTNFMVIKGLQEKGQFQLAHSLSKNHLDQVLQVFDKTETLWEYYAPESAEPGLMARKDFVGWTGLPPIAVLFEGIFGIIPNRMENRITWHIHLTDKHGVNRYPFGTEGLLDLDCEKRNSTTAKPKVTLVTNLKITIQLVWEGGSKEVTVQEGTHTL